MSPSANKFVVVGTPGDRRGALFQAALQRLGLPPARIVSYEELLGETAVLPRIITPGTIVRVESPGKSETSARLLLQAGAAAATAEGRYHFIPEDRLRQREWQKGELLPSRQWYLGFCHALDLICTQLSECPPHRLMNDPAAIRILFDKRQTQATLAQTAVSIPTPLNPVTSYDDLLAVMVHRQIYRVFIKLAHGSSASGVVAYETRGPGSGLHKASTTVEMVRQNGRLRLFNTRRIRVYRDQAEIATLINALCRDPVHVEQWVPKAGLHGQRCDVRVLVIAGKAQHALVRLSRHPMTNLHLRNGRADVAVLQQQMGMARWRQVAACCETAVAHFPGTFYAGVDLLLTPGWRQYAIAEINAFGDLLPTVRYRDMDPYEAEIREMLAV